MARSSVFLLLSLACSPLFVAGLSSWSFLRNSLPEASLPMGGGECKTAMDCELNGDCVNNACVCDAGWRGPQCSRLNLGLSDQIWPLDLAPSSDFSASSWGASMYLNEVEEDGKQAKTHLYANVVCQNLTCAHTLNAQIIHAVSDSPTGPFVYSDIAIPPSIENIHAISLRNSSTGNKTYLLYYYDHAQRVDMSDCTGSPTPPAKQSFAPLPANTPGLGVAVSDSPYGPWKYLRPDLVPEPAGDVFGWGANPTAAPVAEKEGSVYLSFRYNLEGSERIAFARAEHYEGPYEILNPRISEQSIEDPFFYTTPRGLHIIFHQYNGTKGGPSCQDPFCDLSGGHAYSLDGKEWQVSAYPAYTTLVTYRNGTSVPYKYRERPELKLDDKGTPIMLITGVEWGGKAAPPCRSGSVATEVLP